MLETWLFVGGIACTTAFACELAGLVLRASGAPRARRAAGGRLTLRRDRRAQPRRAADRRGRPVGLTLSAQRS